MKGYELHKTGARVNQLLERQFVVPTLDHAPNSSTTTWQDDDYVVTFRIGEQCRVKEDGEWRFYRLQDVENGRANWVRVDISEMPDLSGYYTKQETDEQIANKVSEIELPDMSDYYTKQQIDNKGYITTIPDEYITEDELNAKGYLISVPEEYVTESELSDKNYATEQWVEEQGYLNTSEVDKKIQDAINESIDLDDYYTKQETDKQIEDKVSAITFPDDESILNVTEDEYEELKAAESLSDKTLYFVSKDGSPIALYIGKVQIAVREEGSKGFAYNFPIIF